MKYNYNGKSVIIIIIIIIIIMNSSNGAQLEQVWYLTYRMKIIGCSEQTA